MPDGSINNDDCEPSAGDSTVTATSPHTADGVDASTVTIVLVDAGANPVTGLADTDFLIGLTGSAVAGAVSETGTAGTYEVSITNAVAEIVTVTVTAAGVALTDEPSITFNAGAPSAGDSTVTATSPHTADGVDASTVTIVLVDADANPVTGLADTDFLIGLTGSAVAGAVSETGTAGTYEVSITNAVAEIVTVTVAADSVALTDTASITFEAGAPSAGDSTVTATSPHIADGVDPSTVTIILVDAGANPVTGLADTDFLIGLTGSAVAGAVSETGTAGTYEVSITNAVAEIVTVTVTAAGVALTDEPSITFEDDTEIIERTAAIIAGFSARRARTLIEAGPTLQHYLDRFTGRAEAGFDVELLAYQQIPDGGGAAFDAVIATPNARGAIWLEGTFERYREGGPVRSAPLRSAPLRSMLLRSALLRSQPGQSPVFWRSVRSAGSNACEGVAAKSGSAASVANATPRKPSLTNAIRKKRNDADGTTVSSETKNARRRQQGPNWRFPPPQPGDRSPISNDNPCDCNPFVVAGGEQGIAEFG